MSRKNLMLVTVVVFVFSLAWSQDQSPQNNMSGMNMSGHDMSKMNSSDEHGMSGMADEGSAPAMQAMEGHHMDMGPHMKMTSLRPFQPGDQEKAEQVVEASRKVAERYTDYKVALADGFQIFMPNVPQKQYHFTNYRYAFETRRHFNPDHPTSLLYEKQGDGYRLIGVMYTAPKYFSEDELNSRIPLSVAQWHAHVNLCVPSGGMGREGGGKNSQFGMHGSIATKEACDTAGGKFVPQIFGWMVHVYPFEQKLEDIWSVERQHAD